MLRARDAGCLDEGDIAGFVGSSLPRDALARVEAHLAGCDSCRQLVADAAYGAHATAFAETHVQPTRSSRAPVAPAAGTVIAEKYRVLEELGRGGMGVVLAAQHLELHHRVAIKVIFQKSGPAIARFLREAQTCARLTSEHIARVFDVGRLEDGSPYLVMEHLAGKDLADACEGVLPIAEAVAYVRQACAGIAEAHAAGVVHRDLKPANLFLTARADGSPLVKVLDFGVSKLVVEDDSGDRASLTATDTVVGTPLYMSPEQLRDSKNVDVRTDVWSLGVILYRLLAGRVPFPATTISALAVAIATEAPASIASLRPEVPSGLEAIVLRCLEKDPARRYASVAALSAALEPFAVAARDAPRARGAPRNTVVAAFAGGALVAACVGVAFLATRGSETLEHARAMALPLPAMSSAPEPPASQPAVASTLASSAPPAVSTASIAPPPRALPGPSRPTTKPRPIGPTDTPD